MSSPNVWLISVEKSGPLLKEIQCCSTVILKLVVVRVRIRAGYAALTAVVECGLINIIYADTAV